jgi:hypothetical protein
VEGAGAAEVRTVGRLSGTKLSRTRSGSFSGAIGVFDWGGVRGNWTGGPCKGAVERGGRGFWEKRAGDCGGENGEGEAGAAWSDVAGGQASANAKRDWRSCRTRAWADDVSGLVGSATELKIKGQQDQEVQLRREGRGIAAARVWEMQTEQCKQSGKGKDRESDSSNRERRSFNAWDLAV